MSISRVSQSTNKVAFKGYDKHLDKKGNELHSFYYPHSDEYDLQLEVLTKSKDYDIQKAVTFNVPDDSLDLQFPKGIDKSYNIYYRYKLIDKTDKSKAPIYANDNGLLSEIGNVNGSSEPFNQIFTDRKIISKPGRMQLQMPDIYYPGVKYVDGNYVIDKNERKKATSTVRNHFNKLGGTLNGMTYMLPQKAKEGYTRIVGTPFTKDEVSSHLYWTQNAYQVASSIGNMQDMKRFQQALFKNGINFVADAALVNEGLQGIHFSNLLRWGKVSPFFNWFKTFSLDYNNISLGVIPKNTENVRLKIINSPIKTAANPVEYEKYDPKKPTYVQLYDSRLTTKEQEKQNKPFTKYEGSLDNHYEICSYNDAVIPYSFEVDPAELVKNIKNAGAFNKGDFSDINTIMDVLTFSTFEVGERTDGGVELWDGNVDIAKLNFSFGNYDIETINKNPKIDSLKRLNEFKQGVREVQDYAVLSGNYWAKLSADTQLEFAAKVFKNVNSERDAINTINNQIGVNLPRIVQKTVDKDVISNVFNNDYNLFKLNNISTYTKIDDKDERSEVVTSDYKDILTKSIMNIPLESIETGDDVTSILSSGYLSKRASTDEQIGLSRFDIYKSNYPNLNKKYENLYKQTDKILTKNIYSFVDSIISNYDKLANTEKIKAGADATTFGKYAINAVASDFAKYAFIKALDENANITIEKDGSLNFDNVDRSKLMVKSLGLIGKSPEEEAENLVKKLEKGTRKLASNQGEINKMVTAMTVRLNGLNENSFKLADMIIDRTESGMGLRVDASKDVAAFDSVRYGKDNVAKAWNDVINFWTKYVKDGIHKENPHAFTTAEVTDIANFINETPVDDLNSAPESERKLLEKAGITSIANYSYFFSMPTGIYSYSPESGYPDGYGDICSVKSKIDCLDNPGWRDNHGLIYEGMPDSSIHSYTFVGNHDKPRILHALGLDMELYHAEFNNQKQKDAAYDVFESKDLNFEYISAPAVAMGKRLKDVFREMKDAGEITQEQYRGFSNAIINLASGKYQYPDGRILEFKAKSFGEKPFDVVINDVVTSSNLNIDKNEAKRIKDRTLEKMLTPAMQKFKSIYKMLILLPGDPTDFSGDKEGMTGFESLTKNLTQQNRNAIRWEWLDEKDENYKPFIAKYNHDINKIMGLRTRPELSALNTGHTVSLINYRNKDELDNQYSRDFSANLRYNKDSMVITIFGRPDVGTAADPNRCLGDRKTEIEYLRLDKARSREGLSAGLKNGTIFKNANENDTSIYKVEKLNGENVLRRYNGNKPENITIDKNDDNSIVLYRI